MLGGVNFPTVALGRLIKQKISGTTMVVGAQVSHPGDGATKFCSSIAAVVASVAPNPIHYPGSMRPQKTFNFVEETGFYDSNPTSTFTASSGKVRMETYSEIVDLKIMMQEALERWKAANKDYPTNILFYRGGVSTSATAIHDKECKAIHEAIQAVSQSKADAKLTYIVVSKDISRPPSQSQGQFTFYTVENNKYPSKYAYHVHENGMKAASETLSAVTIDLNTSSQLAHRVSYALPVFYAHKLCQRAAQYLHVPFTQNLTFVSEFAMNSNGDYNWNATAMLEFVNRYFLNLERKGESGKATDGRFAPWQKNLDGLMFYL
jgi:hypothetical protein